jgi:hypothetical protein
MSMHDFRRAAATSLAIEAPDKIGLATGLLQHTRADTTGRHYNLAGCAGASRRFKQALSKRKGCSIQNHDHSVKHENT